jgi:DNA-binding MarR family transcriptional regulator
MYPTHQEVPMPSNYTADAKAIWGNGIGKGNGFSRVPKLLVVHKEKLGIKDSDWAILILLISYQWSRKPAFPHPDKLGLELGLTYDQIVIKLRSLEKRGLLHIEKTKSNNRNFHLDLLPLREKLNKITTQHQSSSIPKEEILKDASIPLSKSIQKDASILEEKINGGEYDVPSGPRKPGQTVRLADIQPSYLNKEGQGV